MYNYCTLFDSNYLTRGLAMYESLERHSGDFHLYVFAFDDLSHQLLKKMNFQFMTVISLKEFEDEALLSVKPSRGTAEYCWTCTPSTLKFRLESYGLESCTYLDADLLFFNDPSVLIDEMGNKSVLITEHRYTPKYDQSSTSGVYCVQFMTFKNDIDGLKVLNWWRDACLEWCYARFEDGKFGDQKYLDDWVSRFDGVHVLQHLGGGLAPWNIQQYDLDKCQFEFIFFHFHNYKMIDNGKIELGMYKLSESVLNTFYKPYTKYLDEITKRLRLIDDINDYNGITKVTKLNGKSTLGILKRILTRSYNVLNKQKLLGE